MVNDLKYYDGSLDFRVKNYLLSARAATHVEKSTLHDKKLNAVVSENMIEVETGTSCSTEGDGECESCQ